MWSYARSIVSRYKKSQGSGGLLRFLRLPSFRFFGEAEPIFTKKANAV
jgi:hypothetical protein